MSAGKALVVAGLLIVFVGLLVMLAGALGLGRLPGDINVRHGNVRFFFPIATRLLLSIVATVLLNIFLRR